MSMPVENGVHGFADRQPAQLTTTPLTVRFRTGSVRFPTCAFVNWEGGDVVAMGASSIDDDGLAVLVTLEDAARYRDALDEILTRAGVIE